MKTFSVPPHHKYESTVDALSSISSLKFTDGNATPECVFFDYEVGGERIRIVVWSRIGVEFYSRDKYLGKFDEAIESLPSELGSELLFHLDIFDWGSW